MTNNLDLILHGYKELMQEDLPAIQTPKVKQKTVEKSFTESSTPK